MTDLEQVIQKLSAEIKRAEYIETGYIDCVDVDVLSGALEWLKKLAKCNHDCKIDCLLDAYNKVVAERDELLEKQKPVKPMVIRKDELGNLPSGSVVWMEERTIIKECPEPVIPVCFEDIQNVTIGNNPKVHSAIAFNGRYDRLDQYGTMYRFWTARPTDEQREATRWEEFLPEMHTGL